MISVLTEQCPYMSTHCAQASNSVHVSWSLPVRDEQGSGPPWPPPTTKIYGNVSSRVIDGRHGGGGDSRVTMCKFRRRRSSHSCALSRHPFLARSFLDASFYWSTSTPPSTRSLTLEPVPSRLGYFLLRVIGDFLVRSRNGAGSIRFRICSPKQASESRRWHLPTSSSPFTVIFDVCLSVKYRKGEERESLQSI